MQEDNNMNITTHNDQDLSVDGTSLRGHIQATFADLVRTLGPPLTGDGYKTECEWIVRDDTGRLATIYDWKLGVSWCGQDGVPAKDITEWNVGGHSSEAMDLVVELLAGPR
jgi:hypothetical protein